MWILEAKGIEIAKALARLLHMFKELSGRSLWLVLKE
jgi:hypothetical protein